MNGVNRVVRVVRYLAITASVIVGLGLIMFAVVVGDCGFAGGRCPSEPDPLLQDDTFRIAAFGGALMVGVPTFLSAPSWRRLAWAAGFALLAGLVIGNAIRSGATQ
jgi:hypothetical protein